MRRTVWEIIILLLLAAAMFGVWRWGETRTQRAAEEQARRHQIESARLLEGCDAWAARLGSQHGEAVFRAFAAGIHPAVLADRQEVLLTAKTQLLRLEEVVFVHLLDPDGAVIVSSDEKYAAQGRADERAEWALASRELSARAGDLPGTTELAAPIVGSTGPQAVLWMGLKLAELQAHARPDWLPAVSE